MAGKTYRDGDVVFDATNRMSKHGIEFYIDSENAFEEKDKQIFSLSLMKESVSQKLIYRDDKKRILILSAKYNYRNLDVKRLEKNIKQTLKIARQYANDCKLPLRVSDDLKSIIHKNFYKEDIVENFIDTNKLQRPIFFSELERIHQHGLTAQFKALSTTNYINTSINVFHLPENINAEIELPHNIKNSAHIFVFNEDGKETYNYANITLKNTPPSEGSKPARKHISLSSKTYEEDRYVFLNASDFKAPSSNGFLNFHIKSNTRGYDKALLDKAAYEGIYTHNPESFISDMEMIEHYIEHILHCENEHLNLNMNNEFDNLHKAIKDDAIEGLKRCVDLYELKQFYRDNMNDTNHYKMFQRNAPEFMEHLKQALDIYAHEHNVNTHTPSP